MRAWGRGDIIAHPRRQEGPAHIREREKQKSASAKRINGPNGGPRKDKVHEAKAETGEQGRDIVGSGFCEDGAGVEGDDVDTTHLLCDHYNARCLGCTAQARDGEKLHEACEHVTILSQARLFYESVFVL